MKKSCFNCWWQEGGKCYNENNSFVRDSNGISTLIASKVCENHVSKRKMLSSVIPNEKLIVLSEFSGKAS